VLISSPLTDPNLHELEHDLINCIHRSPGIRYRELLRITNSSNGVLSYHLAELLSSNRIRVERKRGVTRYYPIDIPPEISRVISQLKNPVSKNILSLLVDRGPCTLSEIAVISGKAPSTISWYLNRLLAADILKRKPVTSDGPVYRSRTYDVVDKKLILSVLSTYIESPIDRVVNNYTEIIEDL
jgi:predicted transcriptional regulator